MKPLTAQETSITWQLYANLVAYWDDVDTNGGRNAADYYLEDATFSMPTQDRTGRAEIGDYYQRRRDNGDRVARHLITNFSARIDAPRLAVCKWVLLLYSADGVPIQPMQAPLVISEVEDVCNLCGDGIWRYASRRFKALFRRAAGS